MLDTIERDIYIAAPVERVWELVTQAEHLGRWFGDAGAEIDLRPGGRMTLSWQEHGTAIARVEEVEPPNRFVYTWAADPDTEPAPGNSTRVEFALADEDGGTRLRVVESGFASLEFGDSTRRKHYAGNVEGWEKKTRDLAEYATSRVTP